MACTGEFVRSIYRPFSQQWLYYSRDLNERVYQMPQIFPHAEAENRVIATCGVGGKTFSVLMSDTIPDIQTMFNGQCFPLKLYEKTEDTKTDFFAEEADGNGYQIKDGISDEGLKHFQDAYPGKPSAKTISSITFTACCILKTTEPVLPIISANSSHVFHARKRRLISGLSVRQAVLWLNCMLIMSRWNPMSLYLIPKAKTFLPSRMKTTVSLK